MKTSPGLKVRTQVSSDKIVKLRKGVMEFLLVNHPLDCPICDKAGECTLQEHYMGQGRHESRLQDEVGKQYKGGKDFRFIDTKGEDRGGKHIDLGPTVVLDQERCIICSRCVRFMDEVAKDSQLAIAGRGDHAYITTFPGKPLDHGYDLNVTDICPVGALTGKHFRFQQRVWMLKSVESIDPSDSLGANITIEYNVGQENGKVWRVMPRRNPSVNKSWLANSSRMVYKELGINRLTDGLIKGADAILSDAIAAAEKALAGARKVAIVTSGHLTTEDNAALLALADKLGARAEIFGGSWLAVDKADGIARSGDPVANRKALQLLGVPDNLDTLVARAGEFDVLLTVGQDLWGPLDANGASKASKLDGIATRIVLSAWSNASTAKATIAIGIRAWAEVRGTMVNCNGRVQLLNACPVVPNQDLEPAWQVVSRLGGLGWATESEAWRAAVARVPQFAGITYRTVGPQGQAIVETAAPAAVGA